jgi:hypothetical protein
MFMKGADPMKTDDLPCGYDYADKVVCQMRHLRAKQLKAEGKPQSMPYCLLCPFATRDEGKVELPDKESQRYYYHARCQRCGKIIESTRKVCKMCRKRTLKFSDES